MSIDPLRSQELGQEARTSTCILTFKPSYQVQDTMVSAQCCHALEAQTSEDEGCFGICKAFLSCLCCPISALMKIFRDRNLESRDESTYLRAKSKIVFEESKRGKRFKVPNGYEHVVGPELTRQFMDSTTDDSIIVQLAQASKTYISPELSSGNESYRNGQLYFHDMVRAASPDQISLLVEACRDLKCHIRLLFSILLEDLEKNHRKAPRTPAIEDEKETLLTKFRIAYELMGDDLSRIFILDKQDPNGSGYFSFQVHEIEQIPLYLLIKWKDRLGLPNELIQKCEDLRAYRDCISPKAESEDMVIE